MVDNGKTSTDKKCQPCQINMDDLRAENSFNVGLGLQSESCLTCSNLATAAWNNPASNEPGNESAQYLYNIYCADNDFVAEE